MNNIHIVNNRQLKKKTGLHHQVWSHGFKKSDKKAKIPTLQKRTHMNIIMSF